MGGINKAYREKNGLLFYLRKVKAGLGDRFLARNLNKTTMILVFFVLISPPILLVLSGLFSQPQRSDVVVIFGSQVLPNGEPSNRLSARLMKAIELYRNGLADYIIVSGGVGIEGFDEALVMREYLVKQKIPINKIYLDNFGNNTVMTAKHTIQLMSEHRWTSVILVSQYFHLFRAKLTFYRYGATVVSADYPRYFEFRDVYSLIREVAAIFWYSIKWFFMGTI